MWRRIRADNKHAALKGIGVYFNLKEKKFDDAFNLLIEDRDIYSVFLRAQILMADKKPRDALLLLLANFESGLLACAGYTNFLLNSAISFELPLNNTIGLVDAIKNHGSNADPSVLLTASFYLEQQGKPEVAVELLGPTGRSSSGAPSSDYKRPSARGRGGGGPATRGAVKNVSSRDQTVQARYLSLLADVDFTTAEKL